MPAPQISPLPNPPSRSQSPDTFSTDADAFLGALPEFQTDANAQATYLDALAIGVDADAVTASNAAAVAAGAANYQGDYNAGTTYQIGESVSYSGRRYVAKTVNTGVTPADGANWFLINDGDVLGPVSSVDGQLAAFDGNTGKIIKSAGTISASQGGTGLTSAGPVGNVLTSDGTNWVSATSGPIEYNNVGDFIHVQPSHRFLVAGNLNALVERGWTKGVPNYTGSSTFSASNPVIPFEARWSNYYNAWYGQISAPNPLASNTYISYIAFSSDGINWWPAAPYPTLTGANRQEVHLTVDDSNGRFFVGWRDTATNSFGYAYTTTPTNLLNWTEVEIANTGLTGNQVLALEYVDFGSTATSGVVAFFWKDSNTTSTSEVYVIAAGTTTAVLKASRSSVSRDQGIFAWDAANKKAIAFNDSSIAAQRVSYVANDVNGTWINPSVTGLIAPSAYAIADAGGGYAVVNSNSGYYYSNTFNSWTAASSPSGNIQHIWHNGTYWFMRTTSGVYYTATSIPTGWTQIGTTNWLVNFENIDKSRQTKARKI